MLKKMFSFLLVVLMLSSVTAFAIDTYGGYDVPVDIEINGSLIQCDQKPVLIDSTTYIPLRAFSDAIGGTIGWNAEKKEATMEKGGHSFLFSPETNTCVIDGIEEGYASVIYRSRTMIPVRAVSETLGYDVEWDDFYLTVKITAPGVEIPEECRDTSYTYEDILYLGKITRIESGYQHFEVQLGVAATVMNRVRSPQFPNSVKDVIFDSKYGVQFPPAHTDKFNTMPSKESIIAAKCALNGANNVGNSLYFIDTKHAASSWAHHHRPYYGAVYDMSFYE
ncbi:MAG: cell wall hydrolase [Clostridia bacterium]|nr:cell wall hydrolase [Clostridia bacterium]